MVSSNKPITPFMSTDESIGNTTSIWALFSHTGIYVMAIGLLLYAGLGIFCCYFFWCQPARLVCQPLQSVSTSYTIADDNVEAAPIYRCDSKAGQPIVRPHKNHVLHMEWEPTQQVDRSNRHSQKQFLHLDHWIQPPNSRECDKHIWSVVRLRFGPVAASLNRLIDLLWRAIATSHNRTTTCAQLIVNQGTITLSPLKKHAQMTCANRSKDTCHLLLFISLDPSSTIWTSSHWYFWIPI